jgi:outer membrane protein OmpA-like peptidoglycan-associated protein
MRRGVRNISLLLFLIVTACTAAGDGRSFFFSSERLDRSRYLALGYKKLAAYEEFYREDSESAGHFSFKSGLAQTKMPVSPDDPVTMPLPDDVVLPAKQAYETLKDALATLDQPINTIPLAEAQVNFDCWLEREVDQHMRGEEAYAEGCKERFFFAIDNLRLSDPILHMVYFDSASTVLSEESIRVINLVSQNYEIRDLWNVHLTGFTDSKGSYEQNVILSMRRAMAVKNALAQHGIHPDKIIIDAAGEIDHTDYGESSHQARRVEISVMPRYLHQDNKGPDIRKIVPHFFGSDSGDI